MALRGLLLLFTLSAGFSRAVAQTFSYDSSFNNQMNAIFDSLNTSKVPFGILKDYAMEFTNLAAYNGLNLADSTKTTFSTVPDIYNTLASGVISTNAGSMVHPLYLDSVWQTQRQPGVITLAGLFYQYAAFLPNAADSGLITVSNNQLIDKYVNGVWQNPYQNQQVFAISPSINSYNSYGTHAVHVLLPANTWLTNSAGLISSMTVDFADGLGARALTTNQTYNLSYSTGGTKTWDFSLTLTNGTVLQSRTDIQLDSVALVAYRYTPGKTSGLCGARQPGKWYLPYGYPGSPMLIRATTSMYGQYASGYMTILYANSDQKIRNPLIIAEGFDPGDVLTPEQLTGEQSLYDFTNNAYNSGSSNIANLVYSGNYDIIYVDWRHGTDFIERNAMLLEAVINYVNSNKITTNPNIIIGQSMGALVTRYALKDMENKSLNHQTGLFISWDGPHQGANVPLAYQYMSRQVRSLFIKSSLPAIFNFYNAFFRPMPNGFVNTILNLAQLYAGSPYFSQYSNVWVGNVADAALNLQDFPAAREMLINFLNTTPAIDNSIHSSWQSTLTQMGYPNGSPGVPFTKVAVSNGSECAATESFSPGQAMFDIRGNASTSFLGDLLGTIALPIAGLVLRQPSLFLSILPGSNKINVRFSCYAQPNQTSAQQYVGTISYTKKIFWLVPVTTNWTNWNVNSNASILPYDYFPGGEYTLPTNLNDVSWHDALAKFNLQVNAQQPSFDFVPIPSALDIGSGSTSLGLSDYLTTYVGALPPAAPKNTPFSSFITAYSNNTNSNESHIQITKHNGDWVYDKIVGTPVVDNCSFFCSGGIVSISGPTKLCTGSQTYSLTGISTPNDVVVNWSVSPSGYASITPNGTQATLTRTGNGTVTLTAQISSASCNSSLTETIAVQVGAPTVSLNGTSGSCYGTSQDWTLSANPSSDGTNWNWSTGYVGSGSSIYIYSPNSSSTLISVTGGGIVNLNYTDNCGNPESNSITVYSQCRGNGAAMAVSPNPSTGMVTLSIPSGSGSSKTAASTETPVHASTTTAQKIYRVKVFGVAGNVLKQFVYPAGSNAVSLDLSDLANGTYIIQVYDNYSWTSQQVVILK